MEAAVIAESMMTGIEIETENTTTRVGQGGTGAQALSIGGNVAVQKVDGIIARLGKVVKKGVPKLRNGTGKERKQNLKR
uniref:Uncharacterized protein n=1 Tax=Tanacetum cinerariifolium TaxID=118510 RepID=A0A699VVT6_TANCI|nr:hypothetical protein [Tanacetum cinerariifolium]